MGDELTDRLKIKSGSCLASYGCKSSSKSNFGVYRVHFIHKKIYDDEITPMKLNKPNIY